MVNLTKPAFLAELMQRGQLDALVKNSRGELHLDIHASFGHYQVALQSSRLKINGVMHHLFVTKSRVAPHPTHRQIHDNLRGVVIIRNLTLHLEDPTGSGRKLLPQSRTEGISAKEKINMAGESGEKLLQRMTATGALAKQTYKIVQEDILNAIANHQYSISA